MIMRLPPRRFLSVERAKFRAARQTLLSGADGSSMSHVHQATTLRAMLLCYSIIPGHVEPAVSNLDRIVSRRRCGRT